MLKICIFLVMIATALQAQAHPPPLSPNEIYKLNAQLLKAVAVNNISKARQLLQAGARADATTRLQNDTPLILAIERNSPAMVKMLLVDFKADVNKAQTYDNTSPLLHAANLRNLELAQLLIQHKANPNQANRRNETPLMAAAKAGHLAMAQMLIAAGADVHATDYKEQNVLMASLSAPSPPLVIPMLQLLLQHGARVEDVDASNRTILMVAALKQRPEAVRVLLQAGASTQGADNYGRTALMTAIFVKNTNIVRLLIKAGADINAADKTGRTALMQASSYRQTQAVVALLKAQADINATDELGQTALSLATHTDHLPTVKLFLPLVKSNEAQKISHLLLGAAHGRSLNTMKFLLNKGLHIDTSNSLGTNALMVAVRRQDTPMLELLITRGANVNAQNIDGITALMIAVAHNYTQGVEYLLEAGANPNHQDHLRKWTALMMAVQINSRTLVKKLIAAQAFVNIKNARQQTALTLATQKSRLEIARLLLQQGADANTPSLEWGHTPLMHAAWNKNLAMVQLLLISGAEPNAKSLWDRTTALHLAAKRNHNKILHLLLLAGADANALTTEKQTPLMLLTQHATYFQQSLQTLIDHGAQVKMRDLHQRQAMDYLRANAYFKNKPILEQNKLIRILYP